MPKDFNKLYRAFNPRCVAVVGDKVEPHFSWLRTQSTFQGKLYSVQINPEYIERIEAMGIKNYTSLLQIEEPVDLVIVSVPRAIATAVLDDCIAKGVAAVHFYTSGFGETGTAEGREMERLIVEKANGAGLNIIGPNCMGIFNPKIGIRQNERQYSGMAGQVGFISQSGTHADTFSMEGHIFDVDINKSVSFGNGTVLDSADYLEYFGQDPEIKVIGMYLEGVRKGARFLAVLREVAARKPVVIWKGGQTEGGARAIASHTGSLAGPHAVWIAAVRQCGALAVDNLEELVDTMNGLIHLPPVRGDRVVLAGGSGGQSVAIADTFVKAGLSVPPLSQESYDQLETFFSLVGAGYRNPVDPGSNRAQIGRILDVLEGDTDTDNLVLVTWPGVWEHPPGFKEALIKSARAIKNRTVKPVLVIMPHLSTPDEVRQTGDVRRELLEAGIPAFPTFERGARALRNVLDFYSLRALRGD